MIDMLQVTRFYRLVEITEMKITYTRKHSVSQNTAKNISTHSPICFRYGSKYSLSKVPKFLSLKSYILKSTFKSLSMFLSFNGLNKQNSCKQCSLVVLVTFNKLLDSQSSCNCGISPWSIGRCFRIQWRVFCLCRLVTG